MAFLLNIPSITPEYVTTLPFVTFEKRNQLPNFAGIYAIYVYSSQNNKPKILYVGKSEDFHRRIQHHVLVSQLKLLQRVEVDIYIAYLALDIPFSDVGLIETIFINKLSPHFNVHHKTASYASRYQTTRVKHKIQTQLENAAVLDDDNYASSKTIRELKREASRLGVSHYSYMTKTQLVIAINRANANCKTTQ